MKGIPWGCERRWLKGCHGWVLRGEWGGCKPSHSVHFVVVALLLPFLFSFPFLFLVCCLLCSPLWWHLLKPKATTVNMNKTTRKERKKYKPQWCGGGIENKVQEGGHVTEGQGLSWGPRHVRQRERILPLPLHSLQHSVFHLFLPVGIWVISYGNFAVINYKIGGSEYLHSIVIVLCLCWLFTFLFFKWV